METRPKNTGPESTSLDLMMYKEPKKVSIDDYARDMRRRLETNREIMENIRKNYLTPQDVDILSDLELMTADEKTELTELMKDVAKFSDWYLHYHAQTKFSLGLYLAEAATGGVFSTIVACAFAHIVSPNAEIGLVVGAGVSAVGTLASMIGSYYHQAPLPRTRRKRFGEYLKNANELIDTYENQMKVLDSRLDIYSTEVDENLLIKLDQKLGGRVKDKLEVIKNRCQESKNLGEFRPTYDDLKIIEAYAGNNK